MSISRVRKRDAPGTLGLLLLLLCVSGSLADEQALDRGLLELADVEARVAEVLRNFERTRDRMAESEEHLRVAELRVSELSADLRKIEARAEAARRNAAELNARADAIANQLTVERARLGLQLQAAYRLGAAASLRMLLDAESVRVSQRMVSYLGYLHRSRARRIQRVLELAREVDELGSRAAAEERTVGELLTARREALAEIERERDRRQSLVASLSSELSGRQQELDRLLRDRSRLEALVESLRRALQTRAAPSAGFRERRGELSWPVDGRVAARFGEARGVAGARWSGLLIAAPIGREVRAVHDGTVVFAEWLRGFGLTLIIDHGDSYLTIYSQNDALYRELGDRVASGDVIAEVGRSGGGDRDALYFEIRHGGKALDPARWLVRR